MAPARRGPQLDFSGFPAWAVKSHRRFVCLACIFDIYTGQLGLGPRTAYSEVKRHAPGVDELTASQVTRPYFDSEERNPRCPSCNSAKRWHARLDIHRLEGGKATDRARRELVESLPRSGEQFLLLEGKSTSRTLFFEWLDSLGRTYNFGEDAWLVDVTRAYLERKDPKTDWAGAFEGIHFVRPSSRHEVEWDREADRLYLAPPLFNEVLFVQYLVSRSHKAGGHTSQGRLTLAELLGRLRHVGFLSAHGVTDRDHFEVLEKLVDQLTGGEVPVKLYWIVDRREFLDKLRGVYTEYAS